jgi:hypothetical protein
MFSFLRGIHLTSKVSCGPPYCFLIPRKPGRVLQAILTPTHPHTCTIDELYERSQPMNTERRTSQRRVEQTGNLSVFTDLFGVSSSLNNFSSLGENTFYHCQWARVSEKTQHCRRFSRVASALGCRNIKILIEATYTHWQTSTAWSNHIYIYIFLGLKQEIVFLAYYRDI